MKIRKLISSGLFLGAIIIGIFDCFGSYKMFLWRRGIFHESIVLLLDESFNIFSWELVMGKE